MMKREQKYPDTDTFHFYNANTHNHYTGDCVIRAIAVALDQSWEQTLSDLCAIGLKYGYMPNADRTFERYLKTKGFVRMELAKHADGTRYTGREFCKRIADKGKRYVAHIGAMHVVAIKDGKVWDIWNSTDRKIGKVWVRT